MSNSIQTIPIRTTPAYEVAIGPGLLGQCGPRLKGLLPLCQVAVITDSTVAPLYLNTVSDSLRSAGFAVSTHVFPAGEAHKSLSTLSDLLESLRERHRHGGRGRYRRPE